MTSTVFHVEHFDVSPRQTCEGGWAPSKKKRESEHTSERLSGIPFDLICPVRKTMFSSSLQQLDFRNAGTLEFMIRKHIV